MSRRRAAGEDKERRHLEMVHWTQPPDQAAFLMEWLLDCPSFHAKPISPAERGIRRGETSWHWKQSILKCKFQGTDRQKIVSPQLIKFTQGLPLRATYYVHGLGSEHPPGEICMVKVKG